MAKVKYLKTEKTSSKKLETIYLIVTGAAKINTVPELVESLIRHGFQIVIIGTPSVEKTIARMRFSQPELLTIAKPRDLSSVPDKKSSIVNLPAASLVLIAPATFNTVSKISNGVCDNYALTIIASSISNKLPICLAPSYSDMWSHPLNNVYLNRLKDWGITLILPDMEKDHVTLAPIEKISDTVRSKINKVKYEHIKISDDKIANHHRTIIKDLLNEFKTVGEGAENAGLNHGLNGCIGLKLNSQWLVMTATGSKIAELAEEDLVLVDMQKSLSQNKIHWLGNKLPSSETPMFLAIAQLSKDIIAIIHTHYPEITYNQKFSLYKTQDYMPYGLFGVDDQLKGLIKKHNFGVMRLHGEVTVGKSLTEAYQKLSEIASKG